MKHTLKSISGNILKNFFSSASLINANDLLEDGTHLIFLKSSKDSDKSFINKIKSLCLPNIIFQEIENSKKLNKRHPIYGKKCKNEKHTVYLCKNQICSLPVISFNELIS